MISLSRDKINMLATALLTELAMAAKGDNVALIDKYRTNPLIRFEPKDRTRIITAIPKEKITDTFSKGYICGFIGRYFQLEEIKADEVQTSSLPKNLLIQVMTDIFGKMRGPSIARETVKQSVSPEPDFMDAYFTGARDLDYFIKSLSLNDEKSFPSKWQEHILND